MHISIEVYHETIFAMMIKRLLLTGIVAIACKQLATVVKLGATIERIPWKLRPDRFGRDKTESAD